MVSNDERKLLAELALSKEDLSVRTSERDQVAIALVASEQELDEIHAECSAFTAKLAILTSKLSNRTMQLNDSNQELAKRTEELQASNEALNLLTLEKESFVAVLRDMTQPIAGNTRILEYIAAGKASTEKQPELFKRLIGFNNDLLSETENLAAAFLRLSEQTTRLDGTCAALERANADLEAMKSIMQQREDFVAALTHDLKNPLISCSRILEFIIDGTIKVEQQPELLSQVIESHKSMLHLIWNIMEAYKSDAGCLVPIPEPFDVVALVRQCVTEFSFAIREKKIELLIDVLEAPLVVNTDRSLLRRVLMNLLDNGVKFSPVSGRLMVSVSSEQQQVRVSIKDSGSGMSDSERERIFDRFWQTPCGRQYGFGSGLGLFLAKKIMEVLGGRIECSSTEQIGTEFNVFLDVGLT
jgi:signal transduction histidine kinase